MKINFNNENKSIIYFASDAISVNRISCYGGYNKTPNIDFLAEQGIRFANMTSAAGSTIMCHTCEWSGLLPHQHGRRVYGRDVGNTANIKSIFKVLQEKGYNTYHIGVGRYIPEYTNIYFSPEFFGEVRQRYVNSDYYYDEYNVIDLINLSIECMEESRKEGKPFFIFCKFHGMAEHPIRFDIAKRSGKAPGWPGGGGASLTGKPDIPDRKDYPHFDVVDGIQTPTILDMKLLEEDYCIGEFIKKTNWDTSQFSIYYGGDHGINIGERGKLYYGWDLYQTVSHVPGIYAFSSDTDKKGMTVDTPISQIKVFDILSGNQIEIKKEDLLFAETMYCDQPNRKVMVRQGNWKYIYSESGVYFNSPKPQEELFDLRTDPTELANLLVPELRNDLRGKRNGIDFLGATLRLDYDQVLEKRNSLLSEVRKIYQSQNKSFVEPDNRTLRGIYGYSGIRLGEDFQIYCKERAMDLRRFLARCKKRILKK